MRQRRLRPSLAGGVFVLLLLSIPGPAAAQPLPQPGCTLVFGHGRNHTALAPAQDREWDGLNLRFNAAVHQALVAAGRPATSLVLSVAATDLPRNLQRLLAEAAQRGCTQVLESTIFAEPASATLVARLRLHPLLGSRGPRLDAQAMQVGAPLYTSQRDFELGERALQRLQPEALGREMAAELLPALAPPGAGGASAALPVD